MPASQVDEQVVKMSFDNSNFDSNVNDSIQALNNLDKRLSIFDDKEHLKNINDSFSNLANTFSIKGQIMFGVLTNLGKEIYGLGKRAFGALTRGIKDGLGEYKTIIDSTEAIYQNVKQNGNSLQDVNDALDELNDYADKTIYNFGQMTRMIGMFSSAGVGLKKSVSTIKGLSNAAALVGANMQRAQIGWNAVSRAMSSGKFTNMTWRSLELSGIAGKQFNKVITEVARNMHVKGQKTGKDIDAMIKKYGSLRESLKEGWLDNKVFTEAMDILSGAMSNADLKKKGYTEKQIKELRSIADAAEEAATKVKTFQQLMDTIGEAVGSGWAQSFRILLGDLEQAKKLYTRISVVISDFIDNNANIRNDLFDKIVNGKDAIRTEIRKLDGKGKVSGKEIITEWESGREKFTKIIENMMAIIKTFLKSVKTGFLNIFPIDRIAAGARKVLDTVEKFTRSLVLNEEQVNGDKVLGWDTKNIENVSEAIKDLIKFFRGLASAADIAWMAISQPIKAIIKRIPFFNGFFENVSDGVTNLIEKLGKFGDKITAFRDAAKDWEIFGYITDYVIDNIDELGKKYPVIGALVWVFKSFKKAIETVKKAFDKLNIKPLSALFGLFKMVVTSVWKVLNGLIGSIRDATSKVDWSWLEGPKKVFLSVMKTLSDYGRGLIDFESSSKRISDALGGIFSALGNLLSGFFGKRADRVKKLSSETKKLENTYNKFSGTIDKVKQKTSSVFDVIKKPFEEIGKYFSTLQENGELTFDGICKKIALLGGGIATAALGVTHLAKSFAKINILNNFNNLLTAGIDVIKAYQKEAQSKMILNIAIAIGILAASMAALSFIPYDKLENGLTIFVAFMSILSMTLPPILNSLAKFNESLGKTKKELTQFDVLNNLTNKLSLIGHRLVTGFNVRMIGKTFKDVAVAVLILVGALAALVLLFKYEKDNTITAVKTLAKILGVLAVSVFALVVAMNLFSKTASNFAGAFSQFAKLAGISGIIMSLALAVAVIVASIVAISKVDPNRAYDAWAMVLSIVGLIGLIAIAAAAVASKAKDFGKLKKITISISGSLLGMAAVVASMALLVSYINKDKEGSWWKAILVFTAVIAQFTAMITVLLTIAKAVGGKSTIWSKLQKVIVILTGCLIALMAGLYALSYANRIPASIVTIIVTLTVAMVSLLSLIAIVMSKSKGTFTTNFVKVIEGIAFAVSAIAVSIGVLAAGLAALIASISSIDVSSMDVTKASDNITNRLKYVGDILKKSLPAIQEFFGNVGYTLGSAVTSFFSSFTNRIVETADEYDKIAEKLVNLVIDIVRKVVNIIYTRKDEIAEIVKELVDFIGTEATAALNSFFKDENGEGLFKKEDVLKWLGISTLTGSAFHILAENAKDINAFITLIGGIKKVVKEVFTIDTLRKFFGFIGKIWVKIKPIFDGIKTAFSSIKDSIAGLKQMGWFGDIAKNIASIAWNVFALVVGIAGIIAGLTALAGYWARVTGLVKDSYNETDSIFHKIVQVLVDGFRKVGLAVVTIFTSIVKIIAGIISGIVTLIINLFNFIVDLFAGIVGFFNKDLGNAITTWREKNINSLGEAFNESTGNIFKGIIKDWKNVGKEWGEAFSGFGKEATENYTKGAESGLDDMGDKLSKKVKDADDQMLKQNKADLKEASPSKVAYNIYWNYILGAKNALSDGGKELVKIMKSNNKKLIKSTITGSKNVEEAYGKIGAKLDTREGLNKYNISYYEYGDNTLKEVELNKELTEEILRQQEALRGKTKAEINDWISRQAIILGVKDNVGETKKLMDVLFNTQENNNILMWDSVKKLEEMTKVSWGEVLSSEEEASKIAVEKQLETNKGLIDIAESKKNQLIGKSKEQAQEIIKNELMQRGMSEEQAEEEAHKMVALMISKGKSKNRIEKSGLKNACDIMKAEVEAYEISVKEETALLEEEIEKRGKLRENAAAWQEKANKGQVNSSNYKEYVNAQRELIRQNDKVNGIKNRIDNIIKNTAANMAKDNTLNARKFNEDYEQAVKELDIKNKKTKSLPDAIKDFWKDTMGRIPKTIDLSTWNYNNGKNKNPLKDDDKNNKKAVDAAKKTKKDLEKNRADLTPTFDLDKLSDEAKKANGIVMSSLMAAQNASIGDYINKDSELNPFMKDRWQNVYNFTQNNYSPKALSRIDIYRQTQRQISMSRGF